jgi:ATP-dependent HslUV protease subunit HslV
VQGGLKNLEMFRGTTILALKRNGKIAIAGDGQVTLGETVVKHNAKKIRKLYNDSIIAGFAGATADAFTLFEKFEEKLQEHRGNITRAVVELAREWRMDRILRRLEALLVVGNAEHLFLISGSGDVIEPDDDILAIGSGGMYALAAARAFVKYSNLSARDIAYESLCIASDICVYTNNSIIVEEL